MMYVGGKQMIARKIAEVINRDRNGRDVVEPFCGSMAVTEALGGMVHCYDAHPALVALHRALLAGWIPPVELSREQHKAALALPVDNPEHGFAAFACSFRGIYKSSYAAMPCKTHGPNCKRHDLSASRISATLVKRAGILRARGVTCEMHDFFTLPVRGDVVLYCDPPYRNTMGYDSLGAFDHDAFAARVVIWRDAGAAVFVSEYDFKLGDVVWERVRGAYLSGKTVIERLYRL